MMAKKHLMDRQKMQLKKQGKLNVNAESVEMVNEVDYSGRPAAADPASEKEKKYPTFAELKAKLAQAGDPSKGIPAGTQLPQTSLKKEEVDHIDEDSRRTSNKQNTQRVRSNIKSFGSNYTPPDNYDPDANRGQGEVVTRKQMEKKRRKSLRQEEVENVEELYKGKHGQSEKEYQDSRSDGGKMVSGDSKHSGAAYSSRATKNTGPNPAGGSKKPQGQGRMTSGARADLQYRKANLKKSNEEFEVNEEDYDRMKDRRQERGGVDGNTNYRRPPARKLSNAELGIDPKAKTAAQKAAGGRSALDIVKSNIEKKYGKGSIMDTKKK
jgi:hypothetical protein